jgi:hypothetical protein
MEGFAEQTSKMASWDYVDIFCAVSDLKEQGLIRAADHPELDGLCWEKGVKLLANVSLAQRLLRGDYDQQGILIVKRAPCRKMSNYVQEGLEDGKPGYYNGVVTSGSLTPLSAAIIHGAGERVRPQCARMDSRCVPGYRLMASSMDTLTHCRARPVIW